MSAAQSLRANRRFSLFWDPEQAIRKIKAEVVIMGAEMVEITAVIPKMRMGGRPLADLACAAEPKQ